MFNAGHWPANSPDLNPIEHVWPLVGRMLSGQVFSNREQLLAGGCASTEGLGRGRGVKVFQIWRDLA